MAKASSKKSGKQPLAHPEAFRLHVPSPDAIQVKHTEAPPRFQKRDRIHPRRILPRVKEGLERDFHSSTREILFHPPLAVSAAVRAATDELTLITNTELTGPAQRQLASNVGEPSVAANGDVVFYTGN